MPLTNAQKQQRARDKRKRVAVQTAQTLERYRGALEEIVQYGNSDPGPNCTEYQVGQWDGRQDAALIARQALNPTTSQERVR